MTVSAFFTVLVTLLCGICCGALGSWVFSSKAHKQQLAAVTAAQQRETELAVSAARLEEQQRTQTQREQLAAQNAEIIQLENLVQELRSAAAQQRQDQTENQQVLQQLSPVTSHLQALRQRVDSLEQQRASQHGELLGQLQQAAQAEQQLLTTSQRLAQALSNANYRGRWGENTLQRIFEATGLTEHIDFTSQTSLTGSGGTKLRPDYLVQLPGRRVIAIDAKAPLSALLDLPADPSPAQLHNAQQAHAAALKKHLKQLGSKEYQASIGDSLELVFAFVPSDDILAHAFTADPALHDYGISNRVMLVSPATIYGALKAVEHSWRQHRASAESREIHALCTELYQRLNSWANHLTKLGASLQRATSDYNALLGSLETRFLPTVRRITAIDTSLLSDTVQQLPGKTIAQAPQLPTAPELNLSNT